MAVKGKWAQGIEPRNFKWILKDQLAVCERPGGTGANHRRVRRQEEIIWIRENGFDLVFSLIVSPHNLHNYDELGVAWKHLPFPGPEVGKKGLHVIYTELHRMIDSGSRLIVHRDELADHVCGLLAGYLLWLGLMATPPEAIVAMEQLVTRQLGPLGRELVTMAAEMDGVGS